MKELIRTISKKEWRFVAIVIVVMIILTTLPYLYGWLATEPGTIYNGLHSLSPGDIPIYYSYINQVKEGNFLVKDLFTSEPQELGTFNVWWFGVGMIARIFKLPVIFAFQLSRLLLIPIFLVVAYLFISFFINQEIKRKITFIFLLFSSGLGVYFASALNLFNFDDKASYWWPIDLWLTEAITFNALYQTSHFIASITLTLLIFLLMILSFEKQKFSYALVSGALGLFYFNFHPYYLPVIFGVLGLYLLVLIIQAKKILWRQIGYLAIAFLLSLPSIIYHFWLIKNSLIIGIRAAQNVTLISPVIFVIIGYGFLWVGFLIGLGYLIKRKSLNNHLIFLLLWLGVNLFLIYSPFPFHSRYTQGLHLVLVIFTVIGLFGLKGYLQSRLKPKTFDLWINNVTLLIFLFILLFGFSNIFSLARDFYFFKSKPSQIKTSLYLPKDFSAAFGWLSSQSQGKIILAADIPSKFIPGFSGQTVYVAHAHETLFFSAKLPYLLRFFNRNDDEEFKKQFLSKNRIDYVFYSDYEKKLGEFNPAGKDYLKLVFDSAQAQIYQVIKE